MQTLGAKYVIKLILLVISDVGEERLCKNPKKKLRVIHERP